MKTARGSFVRIMCVGMVLGLLTRCAPIGQRDTIVSERILSTERLSVVAPDSATATIEQSGMMLHVDAKHVCEVRSEQHFARTTRRENYNQEPSYTWTFAGIGVTSVVAGTGVIVYSQTGSDNEYDPNMPVSAGIGFALVGGALLASAIVDVVRASEATETTAKHKSTTVIDWSAQCPGSAKYANATVGVSLSGGVTVVGTTNEAGVLHVDLDTVVCPTFLPSPNKAIPVLVNDMVVGEIDSRPLYEKCEERAWRSLNPSECSEPTTTYGCDPFKQFADRFPDGAYAEQAYETIERGKPGIRRIEEAEAWAQLDRALCSRGIAIQDAKEAAHACHAVELFIARFGDGPHAREASYALAAGKVRIAALEAKEKRAPRQQRLKQQRA